MRRFQKWMSVGLLALTPGMALAGPFGLGKKEAPTAPPAASRKPGASNQEQAYKVRDALKAAKLTGYEIEVEYQNGIARLNGMVSSPDQKLAATKAAQSVKGVTRVDNRLTVAEPAAPKGAVQQAAAGPASAPRGRVRPANYQGGYEGQPPMQVPAGASGMQPEPLAAPAGAALGYGNPSGDLSHVIYNQPSFPNYSWPSYAQYPNYAAVSYPTQYSASAWPYIGPFYPYPQVPLGWRKATLEWDDGYWQLSFSPRTDRWWWWCDPRNW
ncbi:MAG: BON domain-containing protein [Planctomycetaceae bacterium]